SASSGRSHQWDEFLLSGRPVIVWMPVWDAASCNSTDCECPSGFVRRPCRLNIVARTLGTGMFKAYRVRLPGLIAFLATALMPVVLHSAVGSGGTSAKIFSILGTWTGTWTNANNITTGTESFVVQT